MRNYATHFALLVQLDNKHRIHEKVTEWSAVTLLIKFTSEFATLCTTIYIIIEKIFFKIFKYFSDISNCWTKVSFLRDHPRG